MQHLRVFTPQVTGQSPAQLVLARVSMLRAQSGHNQLARAFPTLRQAPSVRRTG